MTQVNAFEQKCFQLLHPWLAVESFQHKSIFQLPTNVGTLCWMCIYIQAAKQAELSMDF